MVAQAHARLKGSQLLRRVVSQQASPTCEIEQIAESGSDPGLLFSSNDDHRKPSSVFGSAWLGLAASLWSTNS
jgi:hypothetical protein